MGENHDMVDEDFADESGRLGLADDLAVGLVGPTRRSYWVVEGRLAAGAYPGKAGRGDREHVPEVLEQLLNAGIDTFVNLTQDDPSVFPHGTDIHLTRYHRAVDGRAEVLACPIPDMGVPYGGEEELVGILDVLDEALAAGGNAYVHCWGGLGRTGTVVGCWLARHGYGHGGEVLSMLDDLRLGDLDAGDRSSPQAPDQVAMVVGWEAGR